MKPVVISFLEGRGLELSEQKTHIISIHDGFDFLGFNMRKYNGKLLIKPSKKSIKAFLHKIRNIIKSNKTAHTETLIWQMNPMIVGWTNYTSMWFQRRCLALSIIPSIKSWVDGLSEDIRINLPPGGDKNITVVKVIEIGYFLLKSKIFYFIRETKYFL